MAQTFEIFHDTLYSHRRWNSGSKDIKKQVNQMIKNKQCQVRNLSTLIYTEPTAKQTSKMMVSLQKAEPVSCF